MFQDNGPARGRWGRAGVPAGAAAVSKPPAPLRARALPSRAQAAPARRVVDVRLGPAGRRSRAPWAGAAPAEDFPGTQGRPRGGWARVTWPSSPGEPRLARLVPARLRRLVPQAPRGRGGGVYSHIWGKHALPLCKESRSL